MIGEEFETHGVDAMKKFNITGTCFPNKHYMVDLTSRVAQNKAMVDDGAYFAALNTDPPISYDFTAKLSYIQSFTTFNKTSRASE